MTSEGLATADSITAVDDERQFCYRHPQRETALSCGRCERPICTNCAMQGPVGFRCRQCGRPAYDPLTSFTPRQLALGGGVALTAGLMSGAAGSFGILGLCVALFAGGLAAETVRRIVGYKQGPMLAVLLFGGLLMGTLTAYVAVYASIWLPSMLSEVGGDVLGYMLVQTGGWALLLGGIACFGAYSRLR